MSTQQSLSFLRPYLWTPLRSNSSYLRVYTTCRSTSRGRVAQLDRRRYSTNLKPAVDDAVSCEERESGRSVDVAARIKELKDFNALKYPRIGHDGPPSVRVPDFITKYQYLESGASADSEVTLHGRVHSIRRAGSKLVFIDIVSEFKRVQGLVNIGRLEDVDVEQFKNLARLLRRGDHIRKPP